ncbi:purine NTP phosphatase [Paenibacillus darwinianus]|uniref:dITP/XTP pyrophosphatase n=1 Tax=Paenibacillus darwinianus TaxID=1380763 RepID=A0A9W5S280_9BACL|nr:non-canonical purine NTP pyrophosphatase [Paenibacillus darwinianus]EXX89407.1 purine NTP phosphatase [Paenibacillus darwinianus]EXX90187.1 purine NTP phosphatase [Paenibacillus darwinianus]EXX91518.1 purine NTP phosphatase [Paenibacillus darwinianus]
MIKGADTVVVATKNAGKVKEFAHAFARMGWQVRSMFDYDGMPDIVEDGLTFADNARIKALEVAEALGLPALADDSGLEVEALGGAPGVYSARYAGEGADDGRNNAKLLAELGRLGPLPEADGPDGLPDGVRALSRARFVCALALYDPADRSFRETVGYADGWVLDRPLGQGGFGYDPLFWVPAYGLTMGQLSTDEKQSISHRGRALERLLAELSQTGLNARK